MPYCLMSATQTLYYIYKNIVENLYKLWLWGLKKLTRATIESHTLVKLILVLTPFWNYNT